MANNSSEQSIKLEHAVVTGGKYGRANRVDRYAVLTTRNGSRERTTILDGQGVIADTAHGPNPPYRASGRKPQG